MRIDETGADRIIEDFRLIVELLMQNAHYRGPLGGHAWSFFIHRLGIPHKLNSRPHEALGIELSSALNLSGHRRNLCRIERLRVGGVNAQRKTARYFSLRRESSLAMH